MRPWCVILLCAGCELIVNFDPPPESGVQCNDHVDNDLDLLIDCADPDCATECQVRCGNSRMEGTEECDDGNMTEGDTCDTNCTVPRCGNEIVDPPRLRFASPAPTTLPAIAQAVATGDFNGDGEADVIVALPNAVVLVSNGTAGQPLPVSGTLVAVAAGDLDGDGDVDAVVVDQAGAQVIPLFNTRGALSPGPPVPVGTTPAAVVIADLNGDPFLDAAVADTSGTVFVLGNDTGTLFLSQTLPAEPGAGAIAAADLDGDGAIDLVVACRTTGNVVAYRNVDAGFFDTGVASAAGSQPIALVVVDLDGDRRPEAVVASAAQGSISLLANDGSGALGAGTSIAVPAATSTAGIAAGDFDRDGDVDVVVSAGQRLVTFANAGGNLSAGAAVDATMAVGALVSFFANADARLDLAAASGSRVVVALANGEECDDGNSVPGDACLPDCTLPGAGVWARRLGGGGDESATDVAVDADDNVYVVGTFDGQLAIGGMPALTSAGGTDVFVASFTADGALRWRISFGGPNDDTADGVAIQLFGPTVVVVGQAGPVDFGSPGNIPIADQAYAVFLDGTNGAAQFLTTFTNDASTGRALGVATNDDGRVFVGGRFDGTISNGSIVFTGPGAFVATADGSLLEGFTGHIQDEVTRVRAAGGDVIALITFADFVPQFDLFSDGARDLMVQRYDRFGQVTGGRLHIGGTGDTIPGDIAVASPTIAHVVTSFAGEIAVGGSPSVAQGGSDVARIRVGDGIVSARITMTPGADDATGAVTDARGDLVVGGNTVAFGAAAGIVAYAVDGTPLWALPRPFAPARFARDSLGFLYAAGSFTAPFTWGADSLTPVGGTDGLLAKIRP